MKKLALAVFALTLPAAGYCSGDSSFGQIVTLEPSVRANALGDAYTAAGGTGSDGDVFGFFYNPAQNAQQSVGATYQRGYSENDGTEIFSAALPKALPYDINLGLGFAYYNAGDMTMYTDAGNASSFNAEKDWLLLVNASKQLTDNISVGATVKDAHLSLFDTTSGSALLFDAGVLAKYPLVNIGFAVRNVGQRLQLGTEPESFPSDWRVGASRGFAVGRSDMLNATADYVKYTDAESSVRMGGEFVYKGMLAFRLGYQFQTAMQDANTLLYGFGVTLKQWALDYALVPYLALGTTHRISLVYKFGSAQQPEPQPQALPAPQPVEVSTHTVVVEPVAVSTLPVAVPVAVATSAVVTETRLAALSGINFELNADIIAKDSEAGLDSVAALLKEHASAQIEIHGYTDNSGTPAYNQTLSEKRALAVKTYLVGKGIASERISTKGYGDTAPVGDNATEAGREMNRRIEFKVISE